jgi:YD repeat-containing protein
MADGKRWIAGTRLAAAASCLLAGALACSDPATDDSNVPVGPPSLYGRPGDSSVIIDSSYPDIPPFVFVVITASTDRALSFEADELELFGPDGEPLATIHGSLEPRTPELWASYTYFTPTDLNRDLLAACGATSYRISVWTSGCRCETVVEGRIGVNCLPDRRSGEILAESGFDAPAGKPCGMTRTILLGEDEMEEHRYRYDADGRLRFIDIYEEGAAYSERVAFLWESSGYLSERQTVDPVTSLMTSRTTYTYDQDGLLSGKDIDGWAGTLDGVPDNITRYFLSETPWRTENTEVPSGDFVSLNYFYSSLDGTVTVRNASGDVLILYGAPLESPNQVFALPEEVDTPMILQTYASEYAYAVDGRLLYVTTPIVEQRDDYAYECP